MTIRKGIPGRMGCVGEAESAFQEVATGDDVVVEDGGLDGDALAAEIGEVFGPSAEEFEAELAGGGIGGSGTEGGGGGGGGGGGQGEWRWGGVRQGGGWRSECGDSPRAGALRSR